MFAVEKCLRCGDCLVRCQQVDYDRRKAVEAIAALIDNRDAEILSECVTCMACNEYCRQGANPYDLILQRQEERGILPVLEESLTRFSEHANAPSRVTIGEPGKPAISFCSLKGLFPVGAFEGILFQGLTTVEGGDYFCGTVYLHAARESLYRERVPLFVRNLTALNVREVILPHDDCYTALTVKAPEYGIEVPFRPVPLVEYLLKTLKAYTGHITRLGKRIAYQRPCISRYTPETDPLLDELFEIIGVERVPRRYDRQDALCCGGAFFEKDPEKGMKLQDKNMTDARGYGAEAMVLLCPICWARLNRPCRERGLTPLYLTHLCRIALGEMNFPVAAEAT